MLVDKNRLRTKILKTMMDRHDIMLLQMMIFDSDSVKFRIKNYVDFPHFLTKG